MHKAGGSHVAQERCVRHPFFLCSLLLLAAGCRNRHPPPEASAWLSMSTRAAVSTPASDAGNLPELRAAVSNAFAEVEQHLSLFRPDSDIAEVNRNSGAGAVKVNAHATAVLECALRLAHESRGAFDPTVGPLMAAWGFRGAGEVKPPDPAELQNASALVGWQLLRLDRDADGTGRVRLERSGMRIDLGAIAKGYAVDHAYLILESKYTAFMVDLGGNLRVRGEAAPGRGGWRTGIRNPFASNKLIGTLLMTNGEAVATSGNYERFVIIENKRYAHIMDPRTGRPVIGMAGVTVLAPSAMLADGLSTTLFVLGPEAGMELLRLYPGCEALWVPDEQPPRVLATPGFHKRLEPAKDWRDRVSTVP